MDARRAALVSLCCGVAVWVLLAWAYILTFSPGLAAVGRAAIVVSGGAGILGVLVANSAWRAARSARPTGPGAWQALVGALLSFPGFLVGVMYGFHALVSWAAR
jgi:hypothetical protein